MKLLLFFLGLFLSYTRKDETESILAVFNRGVESLNRGDLDGYLSTYADGDDVRWVSGGRVITGKANIVAAVKERFSTAESLGVLTLHNLQVDIQTSTDALVFGEYRQVVDSAVHRGVFTVHLRKFAAGWLILSDHASALDD